MKHRKHNMTRAELLEWIRSQCDVMPDGCWRWRRSRTGGYARMGLGGGKSVSVARFVLGLEPGDPLEALHSCDTPDCVAPDHLRPGTHVENQREMRERGHARGGSMSDGSAANAVKRHCVRGHPFDEANTYVETTSSGHLRRQCRACRAMQQRERNRRRRELEMAVARWV